MNDIEINRADILVSKIAKHGEPILGVFVWFFAILFMAGIAVWVLRLLITGDVGERVIKTTASIFNGLGTAIKWAAGLAILVIVVWGAYGFLTKTVRKVSLVPGVSVHELIAPPAKTEIKARKGVTTEGPIFDPKTHVCTWEKKIKTDWVFMQNGHITAVDDEFGEVWIVQPEPSGEKKTLTVEQRNKACFVDEDGQLWREFNEVFARRMRDNKELLDTSRTTNQFSFSVGDDAANNEVGVIVKIK